MLVSLSSKAVRGTNRLSNYVTGLPHTQGIQGNSGNFKVEENLREFLFVF